MKVYPNKHLKIVTELLDGKFITIDQAHFEILQVNQLFYKDFFKQSFGFDLENTQEYYYLVSPDTNENTSRDISIFFAVLCYELDKDEQNFLEVLNYEDLNIESICSYFENTTWSDIIKHNKQLNSRDKIRKMVTNILIRRNIVVKRSSETYKFTKAYKRFIDYAKELVNQKVC